MNGSENSGGERVCIGAAATECEIVIVWERKRNGPLVLRARTVGQFPLNVAQELLERVSENCRAGLKARFYFRGQLEYDGLPWRGELWLSDTLRLGPPSRIDETALLGPRI